MNPALHVTEAELTVLDALWRTGPMAPSRLIAEVQRQRPWSASTIKTLVARLVGKQAIRADHKDGRRLYRAALDRSLYVESQVQALIDRLFDGDPGALSAYLRAEGW